MKRQQFHLGPGQSKLWMDWPLTHKVYIASAGEQGGKTSLGALWFKRFVKLDLRGQYIVGAPSYKIAEQATKPALLQRFVGLGSWNGRDDAYDLNGGGKIWVRTSKDPDSVVGITGAKGAWLDEAGKMPRQFYYNVESRVARMGGPILITSTPYALNWLAKLVKRAEEGDKDVLYSRWSSSENPTYPIEEFERLKRILPASIFRRRLEGFHAQLEGLVFEHWDSGNLTSRDSVDLDSALFFGGVDWGFNHPFALVVWALAKDHGIYIVSIFRRSGLSTSQQLDLIQAKTKLLNVKHWACGHDRPDMISELCGRKVAAFPYFQGKNHYREINSGNQLMAELIQTKRLKLIRNIEQWEDLEEEFNTYAWEGAQEEDQGKEKPINTHDDLMAAMRYACVGASHWFSEKPLLTRVPLTYYSRRDLWRPDKPKTDTDSF